MYSDKMKDSIKLVEKNREKNISVAVNRLDLKQKEELLSAFHPDYIHQQFKKLKIGENKGEKVPLELLSLLEGRSRILDKDLDLSRPDYDIDVLIIGGGGAGACAAIEADNHSSSVLIVTKFRIGDSNTIMAEGGIQAAINENDSPYIHFLDSFGGGNFKAKKELLKRLTLDAPKSISWLEGLGVEFDRCDNKDILTFSGGGISRSRMISCKDHTGLEIMRTLKDEILNRRIPFLEFTSAIELIKDEKGKIAGAVLLDMRREKLVICRAKTVVIATGGAGVLHYQGFPSSNHYGSTADGLVIAYRAGAKLLFPSSMQYHPTGALFPNNILGSLVTEKARSLGAILVNSEGNVFVHPLETRDVLSAMIIKESKAHGVTADGKRQGVWLDTPMIDLINGEGTIKTQLPHMYRMFMNLKIDITKEPVLVYPTLHYQNGGIEINVDSMSNIENLYVAGEVSGGIHGSNRLMGNSLVDTIVFGRIAGRNAAQKAKDIVLSRLTINHVEKFEEEKKAAGVINDRSSPELLPSYSKADKE